MSGWFAVGRSVSKGTYYLLPHLCNILALIAMRKLLECFRASLKIGGRLTNNLRYEDKIVLIAPSAEELQDLVNRLHAVAREWYR